MLIEFTVENFRSFREAQTLRMDAVYGDGDHPDNLIPVGQVPGMKGAHLLKVAAIYGPNASGKSNVYRAMAFVQKFVADSATGLNQGDSTGAEPFLLDPEYAKKPCRFEVRFIHEGVQYLYTLAIDQERVHEETLDVYPKGRPRRVFSRAIGDDGKDIIEAGSHYEHEIDAGLRKRARQNASFISVGAQWDSAPMVDIHYWFRIHLHFADMSEIGRDIPPSDTALMVHEEPAFCHLVRSMLQQADLGIEGVEVSLEEVNQDNLILPDDMPEELKVTILNRLMGKKRPVIDMLHRSSDGTLVSLPFSDESAGTRRVFSLISPLQITRRRGFVTVIDEYDSSLHPQLGAALLNWFQDSDGAAPGAQLIFTTHDTSLMTLAKMRRDQFWFTEKHGDGATRLYPLTDYKPRKGESLSRGYLGGRYGAIPMVDDLPLVGKKRE